ARIYPGPPRRCRHTRRDNHASPGFRGSGEPTPRDRPQTEWLSWQTPYRGLMTGPAAQAPGNGGKCFFWPSPYKLKREPKASLLVSRRPQKDARNTRNLRAPQPNGARAFGRPEVAERACSAYERKTKPVLNSKARLRWSGGASARCRSSPPPHCVQPPAEGLTAISALAYTRSVPR